MKGSLKQTESGNGKEPALVQGIMVAQNAGLQSPGRNEPGACYSEGRIKQGSEPISRIDTLGPRPHKLQKTVIMADRRTSGIGNAVAADDKEHLHP